MKHALQQDGRKEAAAVEGEAKERPHRAGDERVAYQRLERPRRAMRRRRPARPPPSSRASASICKRAIR